MTHYAVKVWLTKEVGGTHVHTFNETADSREEALERVRRTVAYFKNTIRAVDSIEEINGGEDDA